MIEALLLESASGCCGVEAQVVAQVLHPKGAAPAFFDDQAGKPIALEVDGSGEASGPPTDDNDVIGVIEALIEILFCQLHDVSGVDGVRVCLDESSVNQC